jgi:hypothetical protein
MPGSWPRVGQPPGEGNEAQHHPPALQPDSPEAKAAPSGGGPPPSNQSQASTAVQASPPARHQSKQPLCDIRLSSFNSAAPACLHDCESVTRITPTRCPPPPASTNTPTRRQLLCAHSTCHQPRPADQSDLPHLHQSLHRTLHRHCHRQLRSARTSCRSVSCLWHLRRPPPCCTHISHLLP